MPETVTFDEELGIVRIKSYGDVTKEDLKTTLAAALKIHQEKGINKGFVDGTMATSYPSTIAIHDFGSQTAKSLAGLKVAIAVPPGILDDPEFFETVVRNRGGNLKIFNSPDKALAWLLEEPNQEVEQSD